MEIQHQVDLSAYNSFGVAATAAHFAAAGDIHQLRQALDFAATRSLPVLILGGGSNLLFLKDFQGLVLYLDWHGIEFLDACGTVRAAAGENWHEFVTECMKHDFHGLENLALIPGTVGAAPIQNIGAYGAELADVFVELSAYDRESGETVTFDKAACEFGYRDSLFKRTDKGRYIVLSVTLSLETDWSPNLDYGALRDYLRAQTGDHEPSARQVFDAVCAIRRSKLPDPATLGNAGSFFKNPLVSREKYRSLIQEIPELPSYPVDGAELLKLPAAWLLDRLGWKGRSRGGAAVHQRHALVLVNPGEASGEDLYLLAREMSDSVLQRFGIALEPEVCIVRETSLSQS